MRKMRLFVVLCAVLLTAAASTPAALNPVRATMSTSSTKPLAGTPWRYTIVVKSRQGEPLAAKVRLQILLGSGRRRVLEAYGDGGRARARTPEPGSRSRESERES